MFFTSTSLNLPLFLVTRNRLKSRPEKLRTHIGQHRDLYTERCNQENATETATTKKYRHMAGFDYRPSAPCANKRLLKHKRDLVDVKPWQLAPNRYDLPSEDLHKGDKGATFLPVPKIKAIVKKPRGEWKFYDKERKWDHMNSRCNKHKNILLSNARDRRATSRGMVSNLLSCYHNPKEPGAAEYNPPNYLLAYNVSPKLHTDPPNPHRFLAHTSVPLKPNKCHAKHESFKPGPGRFDTRFIPICFCSKNLSYMPNLQILIDKQKRNKFRRLKHEKLRAREFCAPDWRHVVGNGFRHLFRLPTKLPQAIETKPVPSIAKKGSIKPTQLYPDSKYITMIVNPTRGSTCLRHEQVKLIPPRIRYNCMAKRVVKKQLRNNKKIAFLSGQERFKDADRPVTLTAKQLAAKVAKLPPERQLTDHPIMRKSPSQIETQLTATPKHQMLGYEPQLRKRLFKFLPLPGPKVLVTDKDTRMQSVDGKHEFLAFYSKPTDVLAYLEDEEVRDFYLKVKNQEGF